MRTVERRTVERRAAARRDQRGAVAIMVAASLALLLVVAAFAIDLNMQRVAARDAQATADLVALDVARELDGRPKAQYSASELDRVFRASVARNAGGLGLEADTLTYELVVAQAGGGYRSAAASDTPDAVRVVARGSQRRLFATGRAGVVRAAVATADNSACFRVGSFAADLNGAQGTVLGPVLNALLGSAVNLDVLTYRNLASTSVSLLSLVETGKLGVGTVDELLRLPGLKVADLFIASATVLDKQGNLAQAAVLRTLALQVGTPTIKVADLLYVAPGAGAALQASLNVLDLVAGTAFLIKDGRTLDVPGASIVLPGLGSVTMSLQVVEPMQPGCNNTGGSASTAQVRLSVTATLPGRSLAVPLVGTVTVAPTTVTLEANLGQAEAVLQGVSCTASGPASMTVRLRSSVVGDVRVTASTGLNARIEPAGDLLRSLTSLLGLSSIVRPPYLELNAPVSATVLTPTPPYDKTITMPLPASYDTAQGSGSGYVLAVPRATISSSTTLVSNYYDPGFLGVGAGWKQQTLLNTEPVFTNVVNPALDLLTQDILTPLVATLQSAVITPISRMLGLQLGGADVLALRQPGCGNPKLVQ